MGKFKHPMSVKGRANISQGMKGKSKSTIAKANISKGLKNRNKSASIETRIKMSKKRQDNPIKEFTTLGRIWINNGSKNKMVFPNDYTTTWHRQGWETGQVKL
jgi:hypothetical protein